MCYTEVTLNTLLIHGKTISMHYMLDMCVEQELVIGNSFFFSRRKG